MHYSGLHTRGPGSKALCDIDAAACSLLVNMYNSPQVCCKQRSLSQVWHARPLIICQQFGAAVSPAVQHATSQGYEHVHKQARARYLSCPSHSALWAFAHCSDLACSASFAPPCLCWAFPQAQRDCSPASQLPRGLRLKLILQSSNMRPFRMRTNPAYYRIVQGHDMWYGHGACR